MRNLFLAAMALTVATSTPAFAFGQGGADRCGMMDSRHRSSLNSMCWFFANFPILGWR